MIGPVAECIWTDRLLLEPLEVEHAEEMVHVLGDARLHLFIGGEPAGLPDLRTRYDRLAAGPAPYHQEAWLNWIIRLCTDGQAVGTVQGTVLPGPRAMLAWIVGVPWQRRGIAGEAALGLAEWLRAQGVTDLAAHIHPGNHASAAVARKLGLEPGEERHDGEIVWS